MGFGIFLVLVLCILLVLGFMLYGVVLGLVRLGGLIAMAWRSINETEESLGPAESPPLNSEVTAEKWVV